jgi:hypothetical protein
MIQEYVIRAGQPSEHETQLIHSWLELLEEDRAPLYPVG